MLWNKRTLKQRKATTNQTNIHVAKDGSFLCGWCNTLKASKQDTAFLRVEHTCNNSAYTDNDVVVIHDLDQTKISSSYITVCNLQCRVLCMKCKGLSNAGMLYQPVFSQISIYRNNYKRSNEPNVVQTKQTYVLYNLRTKPKSVTALLLHHMQCPVSSFVIIIKLVYYICGISQ